MKKLLITGFDPFGGASVNPAWEAVRALPDTVGPFAVIRLQVPTVWGEAGETVAAAVLREDPDVILCVGQAGGRAAVTPEQVAINLRSSSLPDNRGGTCEEEPVIPGGPAAYFSTLPVRRMAGAIRACGLPGAVSYSAGTFVCNDLMYHLLHRFPGKKIGFIHVPFLPEQARAGQASLALSDTVRALTAAIGAIDAIGEEGGNS